MSSQIIKEVCTQFLKAYAGRDPDALSAIFSNNENLVVLGTHQDLNFRGWNAFKTSLTHQFSAISDTDIHVTDFHCHVFARETAACVTLTTDYHGKVSGQAVLLSGLRLTLTLEREADSWRIIQSHWSAPQTGSLLHPGGTEPQTSTMENRPTMQGNQKQKISEDGVSHGDAHCCQGASRVSREAFGAYQELTQRVTASINRGRFDFTRDILPYADNHFIEIVEGTPLRLTAVQESFTPLLDAVDSGATFSWTVDLEHACDLTPDIALLVTTARVALAYPTGHQDIHHYRISNVLQKKASTDWIFLHQHRTTLSKKTHPTS